MQDFVMQRNRYPGNPYARRIWQGAYIANQARPYLNYAMRNYGKYAAAAISGYTSGKYIDYGNKYNNKNNNYRSANNGGTYGKKRRYKKKRRYNKKIDKRTKKYMKKIAENAADSSTLTWRDINSGQISCEVNEVSYSNFDFLDVAMIENALDNAVILDPNAGTLAKVNVDLTTIDGLKSRILNAKFLIVLRNNGFTPCDIKCYHVFAKRRMSSSENMTTVFEDGLEDIGITTGEQTNPRFDIYDSPRFRQYFKIFKVKKYRVNAGDEVTLELNRHKAFNYDPDLIDQYSANDKQPGIFQGIIVRMEGVVSHDDTTTSNVGTCNATLDWITKTHIKYSISSIGKFKQLQAGGGAYDAQAVNAKVVIEDVAEVTETL